MLSSPSSRPSSRTCDGNEECHPLGRCVDRVIDDVDNNGNDRDYIRCVPKSFLTGDKSRAKKRIIINVEVLLIFLTKLRNKNLVDAIIGHLAEILTLERYNEN